MLGIKQIQELISFLPKNSDDRKLFNLIIKQKFLNKYKTKDFSSINKSMIDPYLKDLYHQIELIIKYLKQQDIDKTVFKNDLQKLLKIKNDEVDYIVGSILLLRLNKEFLKDIPFLISQINDAYLFQNSILKNIIDSDFDLANQIEYKKNYIAELEQIIKVYGDDRYNHKMICKFIKEGDSIKKITGHLEKLTNIIQGVESDNNDKYIPENEFSKTIELKINDNLRCFTKTIYINEHSEKLIFFSEPPKNHNQADTYIKNIVNEITKIYVCSADLEENEIESTNINTNFGDDSRNNSNPNWEYLTSGEVEHYNGSM